MKKPLLMVLQKYLIRISIIRIHFLLAKINNNENFENYLMEKIDRLPYCQHMTIQNKKQFVNNKKNVNKKLTSI